MDLRLTWLTGPSRFCIVATAPSPFGNQPSEPDPDSELASEVDGRSGRCGSLGQRQSHLGWKMKDSSSSERRINSVKDTICFGRPVRIASTAR